MALLTGMVIGRGIATASNGTSVAYRIVIPDKSSQNLQTLREERDRWLGIYKRFRELASQGKLDPSVAKRAEFGTDVFNVLINNVQLGLDRYIVVQAYNGLIIGMSLYTFHDAKEGTLHLQVIDPEELPGSPGANQLRGIGSALVSAVARAFLITGHTTMYIHPLDKKAAQFWRSRGFVPCGTGNQLCVRSQQEIMRLRDICDFIPDEPSQGDSLLCGFPKEKSPVNSRVYSWYYPPSTPR